MLRNSAIDMPIARLVHVVLSACCVLALVGCASEFIKVTGRITEGGQPVAMKPAHDLEVIFYPEGADGEAALHVYPANTNNKEGSFRVPGNTGKGIPKGTYRVTVKIHDHLDRDQLKGRFDKNSQPFIQEITDSSEVVLEIGKGE